ncbi:MAG: bifunctional diaminohydroxyphosphoribosylaminopyrimidine deaminase/5-amino-6-(5-phosphoribosylamino)uracil reductase RibD [Janthinobacterium lividum]
MPSPTPPPDDALFMRRALDLALLGQGHTRPNPMVGCVVVGPGGTIIGEGYHQRHGGPHAEVNALASVADPALLGQSRVFVTLEPCAHHGKTPPCADLLIAQGVPEVIVCNDDPNPLVAGQGLARLRAAGIRVSTGLLAAEGRWLNRRFFTFFEQKRPYLVLKWAESADGFMAGPHFQQVQISGPQAQLLTHQWRAEEAGILVGTRTALHDNPRLNVREWTGEQPTRLLIDKNLSLPPSHHVLDCSQPTIVYTHRERPSQPNLTYVTLPFAEPGQPPAPDLLPAILADLHQRQVQSVLVEGGPTVLNALLHLNIWDEIRVFRAPKRLERGIAAPRLGLRGWQSHEKAGPDDLFRYLNR